MPKPALAVFLALTAASTMVTAAPRHKRVTHPTLAEMNLTPTRDIVRPIATRQDFASDEMPHSVSYKLPAPGAAASFGFQDPSAGLDRRDYEVNQATALGFDQTDKSVGASLAYHF